MAGRPLQNEALELAKRLNKAASKGKRDQAQIFINRLKTMGIPYVRVLPHLNDAAQKLYQS